MILYEDITIGDLRNAQLTGTLKTGVIYRIISGSSNFTAGGELFEIQAISATQLANTGTGIFQNCDWQNIGDYSDVFALTGFNPVTGLGMWQSIKGTMPVNKSTATMTVKYNNLAGGAFAAGAATSDGNAIVIVSDNGVDTMVISGFSGAVVTGVIAQGGVTADQTDKYIFSVGEVVTGGTSGFVGTIAIKADDTVTDITLRLINGTFVAETLTGANGNVEDSTAGVTYTFKPIQGDIVIGWGGANSNYWGHYQLVTATDVFVDPITDAGANYTFLPRNGAKYGYISNINSIIYDAIADNLIQRDDSANLILMQFNAIFLFPFGIGVGKIQFFGGSGGFTIKKPNFNSNSINIAHPTVLTIDEDDGDINGGTIIDYLATVVNNGDITSSRIKCQSTVTGNGNIQVCNFEQLSRVINNNTLSSSTFKQQCSVEHTTDIGNFTFGESCSVNGQDLYHLYNGSISAVKSVTLIASHDGESIYSNSSSMSASYDAAANEALGVLTIPINWGYIGVFKLSTTPANPITAFTGEIPTDHPFTFAPAAGQTFIFTTTAVGGATPGQIISNAAGATSYTLNGDNGDTAVFQLLSNGLVQLVSVNVSL